MNPTDPAQSAPAGMIEIQYRPSLMEIHAVVRVVVLVFGSFLALVGLWAVLTAEYWHSFWLVLGALHLHVGVKRRHRTFMMFDVERGNLHVYNIFGVQLRVYGAAKGERIVFNGTDVARLRNGRQWKIRELASGRREDVELLERHLSQDRGRPRQDGD